MPPREARVPEGVDPSMPSVARIYDYLIGGKDNYASDRAAAQQFVDLVPEVPTIARANRGFLARCVRFLAESGVRQFIDLGAGIPTSPSVHEVARRSQPGARVVYVDHDPVVIAHGRALLATDDGVTVIRGDLRDPGQVLGDPGVTGLIDFSEPVAVLLLSVLHFISEDEDPGAIVAGYRDRLSPGGYLVITTGSSEGAQDAETDRRLRELYKSAGTPLVGRSAKQVGEYFAECELEEPGLVPLARWRPDNLAQAKSTEIFMWAGVGRKV